MAEPIALVREEAIRERVAALFARRSAELSALLPAARVEHIGSTAVPGSLTKGDLDICVVVAGADFEAAARILTDRLAIHQPENWSPTLASFTAPSEDGIDVGVQPSPPEVATSASSSAGATASAPIPSSAPVTTS